MNSSPQATSPIANSAAGLEIQVLFACARVSLSPNQRQRLQELLVNPQLRWEHLLELAAHHKMLPLLASKVEACTAPVPKQAHEQLRAWHRANSLKMVRLTGELLTILQRFQDQGIGVIPYKGPVLGVQVYGNLTHRQAGDLDLLVRGQDVAAARASLIEAGYHARHTVSRSGEAFMIQSRYGQTFEHQSGITVELHWRFTDGDVGLRVDFDRLEPRVRDLAVLGTTVKVFGWEDLLLILCVHGSKHRWDRLEWICGVAEAVRSAEDVDWSRLVATANELGTRRMLLLGLLLSHDLLEAPVQSTVLAAARRDRVVRRHAAHVQKMLILPGREAAKTSLSTDLFLFQLRERWRDRVRYILYRITTPSRPESWLALSFGGRIVPIHALYRPFRLAYRILWVIVTNLGRPRRNRSGEGAGPRPVETPSNRVGRE